MFVTSDGGEIPYVNEVRSRIGRDKSSKWWSFAEM